MMQTYLAREYHVYTTSVSMSVFVFCAAAVGIREIAFAKPVAAAGGVLSTDTQIQIHRQIQIRIKTVFDVGKRQ